MKLSIYSFIICLWLTSCDNSSVIKEEYHPNGKLKYQLQLNEKNTKSAKSFYENGNLEEVYSYKDNKLHGKYISYYKNGEVKTLGSYKDGRPFGSGYYYKNKRLKQYSSFNFSGNVAYSREYNNAGECIKSTGHFVHSIETSKNSQKITGEDFNINITIANPPDLDLIIYNRGYYTKDMFFKKENEGIIIDSVTSDVSMIVEASKLVEDEEFDTGSVSLFIEVVAIGKIDNIEIRDTVLYPFKIISKKNI